MRCAIHVGAVNRTATVNESETEEFADKELTSQVDVTSKSSRDIKRVYCLGGAWGCGGARGGKSSVVTGSLKY